MIRTTAALTLGFVISLSAQAPQRTLTFDVTSVKSNTSGEQGGSSRGQPGRYVGVNVTLRRVMGLAYLPVQEIIGGPDWINTERFDIEGKAEGTPNQEQMREMLRSLLADRFKLVVHRETRQMPAYALTLARTDGTLGSAATTRRPVRATRNTSAPSAHARATLWRLLRRRRLDERRRGHDDAVGGRIAVGDRRPSCRRSNRSQRGFRRHPDVERGCPPS